MDVLRSGQMGRRQLPSDHGTRECGPAEGGRDALHVKLLRGLTAEARYLDANLFQLETSADGSRGDGSFLKIRTTAAGAGAFPSIKTLTNETWVKYGDRLLSSTADAVDVQLIRHQED